jgi:hypothetical protein
MSRHKNKKKRWVEYIGTLIPQYRTTRRIKDIDNNRGHTPKGQR